MSKASSRLHEVPAFSAPLNAELERLTALLDHDEVQFHLAFETAAVGLAVVSPEGQFLHVNRTLCEFLGYQAEELVKHTFQELTYPTDLEANLVLKQELLAGKRNTYTMEKRYRHREGHTVWAQLTVSLIRNRDGLPRNIFSVVLDISERKRQEQQREETERAYRALSSRILEIQELERAKLAQDLHDEIGQALTAVSLHLKALQRHKEFSSAREPLAECIRITDGALGQVRSLCLSLRPPQIDELGLVAAIRWYVDAQARAAGIDAHVSTDDDGQLEHMLLTAGVQTACFRIVQEAVTNVLRHANATVLQVRLNRQDGELLVCIDDDGRGFDVVEYVGAARSVHSMGILGMQERASQVGGRLDIQSSPEQGTSICACLPLRTLSAPAPLEDHASTRLTEGNRP